MPLSLIIPCFSGNDPNIRRTIDSCKDICDDLVIIHSTIFPDDAKELLSLTKKVVVVNWNFIFEFGYGAWMNMGTPLVKNDWCLLLGVAETVAEMEMDFKYNHPLLLTDGMYRCNHVNDPNTWKRIWNKCSGVHWSGLIHEELVGGREGGVVFRMQDTEKVPHPDPFRNEVFKWMKACTYHHNYDRLQRNHALLGGTNNGWIKFVEESKDGRGEWMARHARLMAAGVSGDLPEFLDAVKEQIDLGAKPTHINFNQLGEPMTEGA